MLTGELDFSRLEGATREEIVEKIENGSTPIEGFMILIGEVAEGFLLMMDDFKKEIEELLWTTRKKSGEETLNKLLNLHCILRKRTG